MERKVWTKDELINEYKGLRDLSMNNAEIARCLDLSLGQLVMLLYYFIFLDNNVYFNKILSSIKNKIIKENILVIDGELIEEYKCRKSTIYTVITVLRNEGYGFFSVGTLNNANIIVVKPECTQNDLYDFLEKT